MTRPINPPSELVQQWGHDANLSGVPHNDEHWAYEQHIATHAAQWGADMELEACCELLVQQGFDFVDDLRAARRPKPPSLKEQAMMAINAIDAGTDKLGDSDIIRRALEALPE
jgi:hypothetical protein